ncbi:metal-dependent transcriptional regulator [candidate division KSB1 bacterium]
MCMDLTPKTKLYLSVIYDLSRDKTFARVTEISKKIGVNKSTVTNTMKKMANKGLIEYRPYGYIVLSDIARTEAEKFYEIRRTFINFIEHELSLPSEIAERNAHAVFNINDDMVINRMKDMLKHRNSCEKHKLENIKWSKDNKLICPY